ncbi:hypothetical protein CBS101457_000080 [Exobasidium rhododendri]|nr:hypothetical protein CBS101457_000080 [Exobasidium rhododendri]
MTGFSKAERIEVIERLAEATLQSEDVLRDFFIEEKIAPSVAEEILSAQTPEEVRHIARKHGLVITKRPMGFPRLKAVNPWQKGTSKVQRKAILQRMMRQGGLSYPHSCYDLLNKEKVPAGYGLKILKATKQEFEDIMYALYYNQAPPPLSQDEMDAARWSEK